MGISAWSRRASSNSVTVPISQLSIYTDGLSVSHPIAATPDAQMISVHDQYGDVETTLTDALYPTLSGAAPSPDGQGSEFLNAATGALADLVKAGVIDPTKITRSALRNAASLAALLLTTEATVADKPEPPSAGGASGMGDMGGMMQLVPTKGLRRGAERESGPSSRQGDASRADAVPNRAVSPASRCHRRAARRRVDDPRVPGATAM